MRTGGRSALTRRPQRPADLFSKGMFRASERGPAGRTHTCRRWRQARDLIIAQTGGRPLLSACPVSGSEGRRRGDSLRNLFAPQLQSDERNSKNQWFLAAFFPPFLPLLEEMGPPEAQKRKAGRSLRPKVTRARGRGALPAGDRYSSADGRQKNCEVRQKNIDFSGAVL